MTPDANERPFPVAIVEPAGRGGSGRSVITRVWLVTGACLVLAIGLVVWNQKPAGPTIAIQFERGYGLRPGNALRHRGIDVGLVTAVGLTPDGSGVSVEVELQPEARQLARDDSQFWIVRPRVSLTRISGLDTVVGARYLDVQPGTSDRPRFEFVGLETPLTLSGVDSVAVQIQFRDGHGLNTGDEVRHRGIVVGEVTSVDLAPAFDGVAAEVRLVASAAQMARAGTQFWIERPTVTAAEIRGLETLAGGRYVAVHPGPSGNREQFEFDGLDVAPPGDLPEGGLEIVLEAVDRGGLNRGVPVLYRGMKIGHVISVGLSSDSAMVEARVGIDVAYRNLVREQSRFWSFSGVNVSVGLKGVQLKAESLSSILIGGVALATPEEAGASVKTGHRFSCAAQPDEEWAKWQPRLASGSQLVAGDGALPQPLRGLLRWQERSFGFRSDRSRSSWLLLLDDGRLLGPAEMLEVVSAALDGRVALEVAGRSVPITSESVEAKAGIGVLNASFETEPETARWPSARIETVTAPTDCLVVTSSGSELSIHASRLSVSNGTLIVDPSVALTVAHHGAPVVSRATGHIIGLVLISSGEAKIVPVPPRSPSGRS